MKPDLHKLTIDFHDDPEIYDAINDFDNDIKFWKKWCKKTGNKTLELCCGTGRVGIHLIKSKFDYTGIDISKPFLKKAMEKSKNLPGKHQFKINDMRSFKFDKKFNSIIMPFNAFSHLYTTKDAEDCFTSIKRHLTKDGLFIFSIFNPNPKFFLRNPQNRYSFSSKTYKLKNGLSFTLSENNIYDKATQINFIKWYYKIKGQKKEIIKDLTMRMYFPVEIDTLLHYNGFKIIKKFGSFEERSFSSDSVLQIIVAKLR